MGRKLTVGDVLAGPPRTISLEKMIAFESVVWDRGSTAHNDPIAAAAGGMTRPFASGQNILAFIHEMMEQTFGKGWIEGGAISVRWLRPIYAGDTIASFGKVETVEAEGARSRVSLKIWAENQHGDQCAGGSARAYMQ